MNVVPWYLNSPHSLTSTSVGINKIRISWFDASNYEDGYEIERRNVITNEIQTFIRGPNNNTGTITYDDNSAQLGQLYKYKVRAKNGGSYSNWSNEIIGSVAYSDLTYPTAYGNQAKVVNQGNNVHLAYYGWDFNFNGSHKIIYLRSTDGGNTWANPEIIPYSISGNVSPSLALDQLERPHILWLMWEYCKDEYRWRIICYHTYKS